MENFVNELLAMIQNILAYFEVADGASVVEIIKNSLAEILGGLGL